MKKHGVPISQHGLLQIHHKEPQSEHGVPMIQHGVPQGEHGVLMIQHGVAEYLEVSTEYPEHSKAQCQLFEET